MKKIILLIVTLQLATLSVQASESIARDALDYMINRYRATKKLAPANNREISLACSGEVLTDFVKTYLEVVDRDRLNKALVSNYPEANRLIDAHLADTENIYPRLRPNLTTALDAALTAKRNDGTLPKVPPMTIADSGQSAATANFALCDDQIFINTIAQLAPLSGSYNDTAKGETYRVPIGENDGDYASAIDNGMREQKVLVEQTLKSWLYDIYRR